MMRNHDVQALRALHPNAIRAYLTARGWHHVEAYGDRGDVYDHGDAPEIVAPASSALGDYALRIAEIVDILASVEEREPGQILRDLSAAATDLIRVRAPEAEDDGSVSIEDGVTLVTQSRELLLAAACAAVRPRETYRAGSVREANDYLRDVRIGQTERGSFIVTLLSPVAPSLASRDLLDGIDENDASGPDPFSRQVTRTLMEALAATGEAVTLGQRGGDIGVFQERVSRGVSANLCRALSRLIQAGEGIDIGLSLALTRPARNVRAPTRARFEKDHALLLDEAAERLQSREARSDERLEGFVSRLARDEYQTHGRVTLKAVIDGALRSVVLEVDDAVYSDLTRANDERAVVTVEGDLERQGQRWWLARPRNVQIAPAGADEE